MNYAVSQKPQPNWGPWKEKFCWFPTRIVLVAEQTNPLFLFQPYYRYCWWVWLKTIYFRRRERFLGIGVSDYIYEYAEYLFDMMQKNHNE
jgi:hypothetical protein